MNLHLKNSIIFIKTQKNHRKIFFLVVFNILLKLNYILCLNYIYYTVFISTRNTRLVNKKIIQKI